jgi:hypothetical protein
MAVQEQDTLQCGPLRATAEESSSMVLPLSSINIVLGQNLRTNARAFDAANLTPSRRGCWLIFFNPTSTADVGPFVLGDILYMHM